MRITFRQLEVFLAVARHENVSRAAEQLALSQSATSASLQELERGTGAPLFDRIGRRLHLNDRGRLIQPQVVALLDKAAELETLLRAGEAFGPLRVGATLTLGNYLATHLVADYMRRHGGARVSLEVANTERIVERIVGFDLDLALVEGPQRHPDLISLPWGGDHLVVFAAPDHPLAGRQEVGPADLAAAQWILREPGSGTRAAFDQGVGDVLDRVDVLLELEHTEGIKRAVESGLGLGCISNLALGDAFRRGSLVPIPTPFLRLNRRFHLVRHREKFLTGACAAFIALCQEYLARGFDKVGRPVP